MVLAGIEEQQREPTRRHRDRLDLQRCESRQKMMLDVVFLCLDERVQRDDIFGGSGGLRTDSPGQWLVSPRLNWNASEI